MANGLTAERFQLYPAEAREIAVRTLETLRELPVPLAALILREMINYDWKFPAERAEFDGQLATLQALPASERSRFTRPFAELRLSKELESFDWVRAPAPFAEQLTAHLWATSQIDLFRTAATNYVSAVRSSSAAPEVPRIAMVLIGRGVSTNSYPLFTKLREHGTYFSNVDPEDGFDSLIELAQARAAQAPSAYGHWFIDCGEHRTALHSLVYVSWNEMEPTRKAVLEKIRRASESGVGSEGLRSMLAAMNSPDAARATDDVLQRFQLSILTEGSGTQIFSTTFVQWTAREALRRAQPLTLLARFAPRVRELSLGELLTDPNQQIPEDPNGALIDADMGAYYTWINQQRLSGSTDSRFLAWFEGRNEALAIGPSMRKGATSSERLNMRALAARIA